MKNRISAPYSFVPLNKDVYIPAWHNKVSQDIPFEDGEDGVIEVRWKNASPLIVRDGSLKDSNAYQSMLLELSDGTRRYFIPGSSLKGMLRNVLAIMSFGKFSNENFDDKYFGYRNIKDNQYRNKMTKVKYGWLQKHNDDYILYPCAYEADKITIDEVAAIYPGYNDKKSAWERNEAIGNNQFPKIERNGRVYRLFATGLINGKKHELLIPNKTDDGETLDRQVVESFYTVYEHTPDFSLYKDMLEKGNEIPVGYIRDNGAVKVIGMGKMLRHPYKYGINDLVRMVQPNTLKHDLCETMFGWTEANNSMKGRVQVGHAFCEENGNLEEPPVVMVLGEPRPSYYPLYLKQDENSTGHNTYDDNNARISGWKRYRIHKDNVPYESPESNENENMKNVLCSLKPGLTFVMRISVHNLRKMEIGALLSAITFHHTDKVWHSIGGAKSFGYGKLTCDYSSIKMSGFRFDKEEYLIAFEEEMNRFTNQTLHEDWATCKQMKVLVAIASEHSKEEVRMMTLEEYGKKKEDKEARPYLESTMRGLHSAFTEEYLAKRKEEEAIHRAARIRNEYASDYSAIKSLCKEEQWSSAIQGIEKLIDLLQSRGVSTESEQHLLDEIEQKKNAEEQRKAEQRAYEEAARKQAFLENGLVAFLSEMYPSGPNCGKYKVDSWKICSSKVKQWMKKANETTLTADEQDELANVVCRLKNNPKDKKEAKEWLSFNSKIWKEVAGFISQERAEQLYNNKESYE